MQKKKTLVIGASEDTNRYSNIAIRKLKDKNIPVLAVGNKPGKVDDIIISTNTEIQNDIDTITLYLSPKNQINYFDLIATIKPRRLIFNPGTQNKELEQLATDHGIEVVHGCTLVMLSTNQY